MKKALFIMVLLLLSVLFLQLGNLSSSGDLGNSQPGFKWIPERPGERLPEIMPGKIRVIPVEFTVGEGLSRVALEMSDKTLAEKGIRVLDDVVTVRNGIASSGVSFELDEKVPPLRYDLEITARDVATGRIIGRGTVPFAVYPYFLNILKCSC